MALRFARWQALEGLRSLSAGGTEQERVLAHDRGLAYRIQSLRGSALIEGIPVLERNPGRNQHRECAILIGRPGTVPAIPRDSVGIDRNVRDRLVRGIHQPSLGRDAAHDLDRRQVKGLDPGWHAMPLRRGVVADLDEGAWRGHHLHRHIAGQGVDAEVSLGSR